MDGEPDVILLINLAYKLAISSLVNYFADEIDQQSILLQRRLWSHSLFLPAEAAPTRHP